MRYRTLLRIVAWAALLLIIISTLAPIEWRPHSGLPVQFERLAAFVLVGFLMALAYPRHLLLCALLVLGAAVALEVLQLVTPSRHGRGIDLLAKLVGGAGGIALGWVLNEFLPTRLAKPNGHDRR